jgi:simple sugar transport system permease protein
MGYQLRAVGFNKDAAEFAGINVRKNTILAMAISGALAGIAGCVAITGASPFRISTLSVMEGFGFDGLSVALIAGSSPIGCIFSAILLAGLRYGGQSIQSRMGVPSEVISIMIGTIVFFIAISTVITMIINAMQKKRNKRTSGSAPERIEKGEEYK